MTNFEEDEIIISCSKKLIRLINALYNPPQEDIMAVSKEDWEALECKIVADFAAGVNIASYSLAGRTFSYRTLEDQRKMLQYVQSRIIALSGDKPGYFQLTRMSNL